MVFSNLHSRLASMAICCVLFFSTSAVKACKYHITEETLRDLEAEKKGKLPKKVVEALRKSLNNRKFESLPEFEHALKQICDSEKYLKTILRYSRRDMAKECLDEIRIKYVISVFLWIKPVDSNLYKEFLENYNAFESETDPTEAKKKFISLEKVAVRDRQLCTCLTHIVLSKAHLFFYDVDEFKIVLEKEIPNRTLSFFGDSEESKSPMAKHLDQIGAETTLLKRMIFGLRKIRDRTDITGITFCYLIDPNPSTEKFASQIMRHFYDVISSVKLSVFFVKNNLVDVKLRKALCLQLGKLATVNDEKLIVSTLARVLEEKTESGEVRKVSLEGLKTRGNIESLEELITVAAGVTEDSDDFKAQEECLKTIKSLREKLTKDGQKEEVKEKYKVALNRLLVSLNNQKKQSDAINVANEIAAVLKSEILDETVFEKLLQIFLTVKNDDATTQGKIANVIKTIGPPALGRTLGILRIGLFNSHPTSRAQIEAAIYAISKE